MVRPQVTLAQSPMVTLRGQSHSRIIVGQPQVVKQLHSGVCVCVYFPQSHIILLFLPYRSEYASFNCLSACKISIHAECFISVLPYLNLNTQSEAVSNGQMLVDSHTKKCFEESHCKTLKYTGFICVCIWSSAHSFCTVQKCCHLVDSVYNSKLWTKLPNLIPSNYKFD